MNWGDELCGVKVTPESWAGGIVEWSGEWEVQESSQAEWAAAHYALYHLPIFPPRGWADKTDAELWREVFGDAAKYLWRVPTNEGGNHACLTVNCDLAGGCFWMDLYADASELESEDATTLILALQNAQVLARRLA